MTNEKIESIYKMLDKKTYESIHYYNLTEKMLSASSDDLSKKIFNAVRDAFTFNGKYDEALARKSVSNIGVVNKICKLLDLDDVFYQIVIDANKSDDILKNICNNHFLSVKYGDPTNSEREDYSLNDMLFYIVEIIFGMDTIINSYFDKDAFTKRINYITQNYAGDELSKLLEILVDMYYGLKDIEDEKFLKNKIREYKEALRPYIKAGLNTQIDETINSNNKKFSTITRLEDTVVNDILGYSLDKKM